MHMGSFDLMAVIHLQTVITAPQERVFDLSRSIDFHLATAEHTGERVVAGVRAGLIGLDQDVTWEATHFYIKQRLKVKITKLDRPYSFQDVMLQGAFRSMQHDHIFENASEGTVMMDRFEFYSPLGILGRVVDGLFLEAYMRRFLLKRNALLKQQAESEGWRKYLQAEGVGRQ